MKNLYLCQFTLVEHRYPDGHEETPGHTRLVWAATEDEAKEKLVKAIEVDDPYAYSARAEYISIHQAIE